jgi:hypothetical protein
MAAKAKERTGRTPRRWLRRILVVLVVLVLLLVALVGLAPRLVPSLFTARMDLDTGGVFEATGWKLRWFDGQQIDQIRLWDEQGAQVADLSLEVPVPLFDIVMGQRRIEPIRLTGKIDLERRADGSLNLTSVVGTGGGGSMGSGGRSAPPTGGGSGEIRLPSSWAATLDLSGLVVSYRDATRANLGTQTVTLTKGLASYSPSAGVALDFDAGLASGGSLTITGATTTFSNVDRVVDPRAVVMELAVAATDVPIGLIDSLAGSNGLLLGLVGDLLQVKLDVSGGMTGATAVGEIRSPGVTGDLNLDWSDGVLRAEEGSQLLTLETTISDELLLSLAPDQPLRLAGTAPKLGVTISEVALPLVAGEPLDLRTARASVVVNLDPAELTTGTDLVERLSISGLRAEVSTEALADGLHLTAGGSVAADGAEEGVIDVDVALTDLLDAEGGLSPTTAMAQGEAALRQLPTSILQPLVAGLGLDAGRDIGPTLDVTLSAWSGLGAGSGAETQLGVVLQAEKVRAVSRAVLAGEELRSGGPAELHVEIPGELLQSYLPAEQGWQVAEAGTLDVSLDSFALPMDFTKAAEALQANAVVTLAGQRLTKAEGPTLVLPELKLSLNPGEAAKQQRLQLEGTLEVDGAVGTIAGDIRLADPAAALTGEAAWQDRVLRLEPTGEITLSGVDLRPFLAGLPEGLPIDDLLGGPVTLALRTQPTEATLALETELRTETLNGSASAALSSSAIATQAVTLNTSVSPAALAAIINAYVPEPEVEATAPAEGEAAAPKWSPRELTFLDAVPVQVTVSPWRRSLVDSKAEAAPLVATVITPTPFRLAGLPLEMEPISLARVRVDAEVDLAGEKPKPSVKLAAAVDRPASEARLAFVEATLGSLADGSPTIEATIKNIDVAQWEGLLQREAGSLVGLLGPAGDVSASLSSSEAGQQVHANLNLRRLQGDVRGSLAESVFELAEPAELSVVIAPEVLTKALSAVLTKPAEQPGASPPPPLAFDRATTATVNLRALTLNISKPLDPAALVADVTATANQVRGKTADDTPFAYRDVKLALATETREGTTPRLRTDLTGFSLTQQGNAEKPAIDVHLGVTDMLGAAGLTPKEAKVTGTLRVENLSMALVDELAGARGILQAALGSNATADIELNDFSRESGTLAAGFTSDNGELNLQGEASEGVFALGRPLTASLLVSEAMSELVLKDLIPIYELRKTPEDGPATLKLTDFRAPLDGDLSKLNGTLDLDLGRAMYVLREPFNSLVAAVDNDVQGNIRQVIPPIEMTITDGVVRYAELPVVVNRTRMLFTGRINLQTRNIRLDTEIPFEDLDKGLLRSFGGLGDLRDILPAGTMFPIVIKGTIKEPKLDVEAGLKKLQEDVGKGLLEGGLENAFKDLLGG